MPSAVKNVDIDSPKMSDKLQSNLSDDSLMEESLSSFAIQNLTFKELFDYIKKIEENYEVIKTWMPETSSRKQ